MPEPTPQDSSPLQNADAASLNELMNRDPLDLSEQDLQTLIAIYRKQRVKWQQDEAKKQSRPKKSKTPPKPNLDLDDLGI